jgi:predicted O-methyltransferase YrrM
VRVRTLIGRRLESTLGRERADWVRRTERRARRQLAERLAPAVAQSSAAVGSEAAPPAATSSPVANVPALGEPNDRHEGGWVPSDPFVPHPTPRVTRHDLLRGLHRVLTPRTYLEIGVNEGASLTLSRARTVAVDPEFAVRHALHCDLDLVKAKSDDFFTRSDPLAHLGGTPVDLAFIDGMHLSEFAVRDFINVERQLAPGGVAVFDDVLPRNALEAARVRRTSAWAGDVYKAVRLIAQHRPDLVVVLINTWPTGTAVVVGADPSSAVLQQAYLAELSNLEATDPQSPPQEYLTRSAAVDPEVLLASEAWPLLVAARESDDPTLIAAAKRALQSIPRLG